MRPFFPGLLQSVSVMWDTQGGVWMSLGLDRDPASGAHVPPAGTRKTRSESQNLVFFLSDLSEEKKERRKKKGEKKKKTH